MAKLVYVSSEEAENFGYPKSCLHENRYRWCWDGYLVDRRRRVRMRRRGIKASRYFYGERANLILIGNKPTLFGLDERG